MVFKFLITTNASEVRLEIETATFRAFVGSIWLVFLMCMLALATCPPGVHIEALAPDKPPLTNFLWSSRYELKRFARTVFTRNIELLLGHGIIVRAEQVSTEALRL